jgi:hypothetical protein
MKKPSTPRVKLEIIGRTGRLTLDAGPTKPAELSSFHALAAECRYPDGARLILESGEVVGGSLAELQARIRAMSEDDVGRAKIEIPRDGRAPIVTSLAKWGSFFLHEEGW